MGPLESAQWPPLPHLTRDQFFWSGSDMLSAWAGFQRRCWPHCAKHRGEISDGTVSVSLTPRDETDVPTPAQLAAYAHLQRHQVALAGAVLERVLAYYPDEKQAYEGAVDETWPVLPDVTEPTGFRPLIGLSTVHILSVERDGLAYVGFEFGCAWDEEHGLGVLTHGLRTVGIGQAEVSSNDRVPDCDLWA